jgi:hypothetical protein
MDAAAMTELLHRLSGSRMDPNLAWTLKDWENRYSGVSLYQGIVLTLSAERRYLAETMAPLIARNLAPGVYLLSAAEQSEAVQVLRKAGVDIIAQPPLRSGAGSGKAWHSPYPSPEGSRRGEGIFNPVGDEDRPRKNEAEQKKEHFRSVLAKMQLPKSVRDELAARIDRRLILSESQLTGVSVRYEKREAQGLDFVGKTAIAKQAIASASLVEILWPSPGGGQNRALGIPEALEKQGGETILVVRPMAKGAEPRGTPLRLPLGKISLLRRIKQSIFEG